MHTGVEAIETLLRAFERHDDDGVLAICHEDVSFEFPFINVVADRRRYGAVLGRTMRNMDNLRFADIDVQALAEPGEFVATYSSTATIAVTGAPYRQQYITRFTLRDDRISRFVEYFNTAVFMAAMARPGGR